jgi:hypothetical protein
VVGRCKGGRGQANSGPLAAARMSRRFVPVLLSVSVLSVSLCSGCSTSRLLVKPDQPEAALFAISPDTGEAAEEVGRGEIQLSGERLNGSAFVIRRDGFEDVYLYVSNGLGDNQLNVVMKPNDKEMLEKLQRAQAEVESLRKALSDQVASGKQELQKLEQAIESASRIQHFVTLGSQENAARLMEQVQRDVGDGPLPAYLYVLKAKTHLLSGDRGSALTAVEEALRRNGQLIEAQRLLDALKK